MIVKYAEFLSKKITGHIKEAKLSTFQRLIAKAKGSVVRALGGKAKGPWTNVSSEYGEKARELMPQVKKMFSGAADDVANAKKSLNTSTYLKLRDNLPSDQGMITEHMVKAVSPVSKTMESLGKAEDFYGSRKNMVEYIRDALIRPQKYRNTYGVVRRNVDPKGLTGLNEKYRNMTRDEKVMDYIRRGL